METVSKEHTRAIQLRFKRTPGASICVKETGAASGRLRTGQVGLPVHRGLRHIASGDVATAPNAGRRCRRANHRPVCSQPMEKGVCGRTPRADRLLAAMTFIGCRHTGRSGDFSQRNPTALLRARNIVETQSQVNSVCKLVAGFVRFSALPPFLVGGDATVMLLIRSKVVVRQVGIDAGGVLSA
jgi:hypothetical protein